MGCDVLVRPGNTADMIARVWPRAEEFGFEDEMDAFGLQFGHGEANADDATIAELHEKVVATSPVGHTVSRAVPLTVELV